jgi:hypothetical protein
VCTGLSAHAVVAWQDQESSLGFPSAITRAPAGLGCSRGAIFAALARGARYLGDEYLYPRTRPGGGAATWRFGVCVFAFLMISFGAGRRVRCACEFALAAQPAVPGAAGGVAACRGRGFAGVVAGRQEAAVPRGKAWVSQAIAAHACMHGQGAWVSRVGGWAVVIRPSRAMRAGGRACVAGFGGSEQQWRGMRCCVRCMGVDRCVRGLSLQV